MKAMVFAAGLGTRLKPITDSIPKALVPINGKPLLEHILRKLIRAGFDEIIVNVHHFPEQIIEFIEKNDKFGVRIEISDETELLLETGGGIRKASWFFDDGLPFLVHNVDILSNLDVRKLYRHHVENPALATLTVSQRDTFRYFLFDENKNLKGWINEKTGQTKPEGFLMREGLQKLAFSGIQILSPRILPLLMAEDEKFSITDFYLKYASEKTIRGYVPDDYQMLDIGKIDILDTADKFLQELI